MEEDDLDRCRDFLPSLTFLVGLLAGGGGDFGIANSKPTLGSELAGEKGVTDEPVWVPAAGSAAQVAPSVVDSGASADSTSTIESDADSVGAIELGVDNAGASAGVMGTIDGWGITD